MNVEDTFFNKQKKEQKTEYLKLLEIMGKLSQLFSDNKIPYLHYRSMENIFCRTFTALNLARSDVSADAKIKTLGVGLKTFIHGKGESFQKIAEFNKISPRLKALEVHERIKLISKMRNERIESTKRICKVDKMIYHLVTRCEGEMFLYEENMDLIQTEQLHILKEKPESIIFSDEKNEYSFNNSKSVLLKRFLTPKENRLAQIPIEIITDPYEILLQLFANFNKSPEIVAEPKIIDYIVLPLYSPITKKVEKKSGLNQWCARGRKRDEDEVYIIIPVWIHKKKKDFFIYNTEDNKTAPFDVILPSGDTLSMKVAQDGGKALMSNPNTALGKWILRDVLALSYGEPVTKEMLDNIGIDSVKLSKRYDGVYMLDFLKTGSYELFERRYNAK
ncbi:MAG: NgoFVII family restriction endonuclease [Treponemataceae bacterium]